MKNAVLITGASSGLGLEFSKIFAREGYNLVLVARHEKKLLELKDQLEELYRIKVEVIPKDLSKQYSAKELFEATTEKNIEVEVLVNNAGFGDFGDFINADLSKQEEMVDLNVKALMQLSHMYLKGMKERDRGKLLNVASVAAFEPGPLMSVYYATKAFVLSFTEALSVELKDTNIIVSALCPGPTKTGFEKKADTEGRGIFKNLKVSTSKYVAEYGYKSLMKGKVIATPGLNNKTLVFSAKISPRSLVRRVSYLIQKV